MELFGKDKYSKDGFLNPDDAIDPSQRDAKWFKQKCEWIYSLYMRDRSGIAQSRIADFERNRLYARGMQPNEKYLEILAPRDKKTNKRKMFMNISLDILPVMPKFRSVVMGMFEKMDFKIVVNAIDEKSDDERNTMKFKLWVEKQEQEFLSMYDKGSGTDSEHQEQPFIPESMEELEMMAEVGAFKLKQEIAMEKAINLSFYNSEWENVKRQMIEDFIDLGIAACKDYVDPTSQKVLTRYVDPANLIIRWGRKNDFADITEAGEIQLYTINQVRELCPDIDEQALRGAALAYNGMYGNPGGMGINSYYNSKEVYEQNKVLILDCEFEAVDRKVFQTRKVNGNEVMFEEKSTYNRKSDEKRKVDRINLRQWLRCKWIVGTDIVFDFGYQHDVPRPKKNKPSSSYHVFKVAEKSMIESCIVALDNIQLNHMKLLNDMAKSPPAGVKVEWSALSNIAQGGEKLSPWELMAMYRQTGDLIYRGYTANGNPIQGTNDPVQELRGGMGQILEERIRVFEFNFNLIRDITGVNQVADASAPQNGALNGTSQMALNATMNVLTPILYGYKHLKEKTARNFCLRSQIVAMNNDIEGEMPLGAGTMQVIKVGGKEGIDVAEFGIKVEATSNEEQKGSIMEAAKMSMQAGKNGAPGITMKDYLFIKRMVDQDQIRYAEFVLGAREEQEYRKQQENAAKNAEQNAQIAQQQEQVKAQAAQQALQMKMQADMELEKIKTQAAIQLDNVKTQNLMKLKEFEFQLEQQYGKPTEVKAVQSV